MVWTLLAALGTPAHACGGLFCNVAQPVIQNAERIVFDVDRDEERVEMHVQISYEGPAEEFAWVVPVSSLPELFVSSQGLFDTLALQTAPTFVLNTVQEGKCTFGRGLFGGVDFSAIESAPVPADAGGSTGVVVLAEQRVGPYETLTLKADSSAALVDFLQKNDYDLTDQLGDVLAPYVADEAYFVALRLAKDEDTGDIAPLGLTYQGTQASIPIQLTAVAAADDMRLEVYLFSDVRAVPESYLHVQINEAAIDWWNQGQNYPDVITQAADEAGGNAFATDYFGEPTAGYEVNPDIETWLRDARTGEDWVSLASFNLGVQVNDEIAAAIADAVGLPLGVDPIDFVNCPTCFDGWQSGAAFDPGPATDEFMTDIVEPLIFAERLFDRPRLTRLTSSLSANEMTVDPVFTLNADMDDQADFVSNVHNADLVYECGNGTRFERAERRLELTDGRVIRLPSEEWFTDNETTEFELIEELGATKAQVIERTGDEGEPEVLFDFTAELFDLVDNHNANVRTLLSGCGGCQAQGGAPSAALLALALGLVGLRRRRG